MTDLYAFRALRSPRRVEPADDDATLRTEWTETDSRFLTHVRQLPWAGDVLLPALRATLETDPNPAASGTQLATDYLESPWAITLATLRGGVDPTAVMPTYGSDEVPAEPVPGQFGLFLIDRLDRWLVQADNRPAPEALDEWLTAALHDLITEVDGAPTPDTDTDSDTGADTDTEVDPAPAPARLVVEDRTTLHGLLGATWARILDSLCAAVLLPHQGELAQRLNRLLLVAGLVERRSYRRRPLTSDESLMLLSKRIPLLPDPPFPDILPRNQVRLVRKVSVSDLFVVRQEWRSYVPDEIADITNVLAGEASLSRTTRIDESELVETSSSEQDAMSETSSESSSESTFSEETRRSLELELHAEAQVDVSATYGVVTLDASAGFSADFSLEDSSERATEVAKSAVSRAASRVETRTREERTRRTLSRLETVRRHALTNDTGTHQRGIYRWVKRIDRFQVVRYPDRMQLEFQIPEPGRFLLAQLRQQPNLPGAIPEPPAFALPPQGITRGNYLALAAAYGATGLPEPPQQTIGASAALTLAPTAPSALTGVTQNPPQLMENTEIALTPGYAATGVSVALDATPLRALWRRENTEKAGYWDIEGFHTITASLAVADQLVFHREVGTLNTNTNNVQGSGSKDVNVQYLEAHLHAEDDTTLTPPVTVKVPIAVTVTGAGSATIAVSLTCTLTQQGEDAWRQDVYDALHTAHDLWLREWRAAQSQGGRPTELAERSPGRHTEMIKAEIRRHVMAWLLGESPFMGRPAMPAPTPDLDPTPDIDVPLALSSAATIQFLEQCFEWTNLAYVPYPYYWADRERWPALMDLETNDPALGQFLRAGSIRVVVPARRGFGAAVAHWLTYRQPWLGGGTPPVPGHPLFVSVAQEIRDQTMPPPDGEPGESWEVVLPTTLQWLDDGEELPANGLARLGQAPHEPAVVLSTPGP